MFKINKILEYLFYIFVLLLPWQTRYIWHQITTDGFVWQYGELSLYAFDIIFLLLLATWLVGIKFQISIKKISKQNLLWVLFFLFILTSLIWSADKLLTFYTWLRLVQVLILIHIARHINFSKIKALNVACLSLLVSSLLGIWQFVVGHSPASKWLGLASRNAERLGDSVIWNLAGDRFLRAYGTFSHPNVLAGALVVVILILIYLLTQQKYQVKQKIFWLFSLVVFFLAFIFTFSRAGLLALILGLVLLTVWQTRNKDKKIFNKIKSFFRPPNRIFISTISFLVIIFLLTFMSCGELFLTRFGLVDMQSFGDHSTEERIDDTHESFGIIKDNFWLGMGAGSYTRHLQDVYPARAIWEQQPVHNIYLLTLAELGIIGWGLLWGSLFWHLRSKWQYFSILQKTLLITLGVLFLFDHFWWSGVSGIFVASMVFFSLP